MFARVGDGVLPGVLCVFCVHFVCEVGWRKDGEGTEGNLTSPTFLKKPGRWAIKYKRWRYQVGLNKKSLQERNID